MCEGSSRVSYSMSPKGIRLVVVHEGLRPAHLAVTCLRQLVKMKIPECCLRLTQFVESQNLCTNHPGTRSLKIFKRTRALAVAGTCLECRSVPVSPANLVATDATV